jgi:hypothetical protein
MKSSSCGRRRTLFTRLGVVAIGLLGILDLTAAPAVAKTPKGQSTTRNPFAGYVTAPTTISSVTATIKVPALTCAKKTQAVTAAATVYDSSNANFSSAIVYLGCSRRKETLVALAEVNNTTYFPSVDLNTGDTVVLSATCGASGIKVTIDDTATNSSANESAATAETCTQAEAGQGGVLNDNGSSLVSLPTFGAVDFTAAMVNGSALSSVSASEINYFEGKKNVITAGPLTESGTAFTTTQG